MTTKQRNTFKLYLNLNNMKLSIPLVFHVEELIAEYGAVELVHSIIVVLQNKPKYQRLIQDLERIRDAIGNIVNSENSGAVDPEKVDRPNDKPQIGES